MAPLRDIDIVEGHRRSPRSNRVLSGKSPHHRVVAGGQKTAMSEKAAERGDDVVQGRAEASGENVSCSASILRHEEAQNDIGCRDGCLSA